MKTITVKVPKDHLETLSKVKKPILSIAELIWNSLDADADEVKVSLKYSRLGELEYIQVTDDGHGLDLSL